jgi:hypothetical protein
MTVLRDLIDVPEHVQKGDFMLRLSEGIVDPAGTLGEYVVTPELVRCFDQALDFIRDAVARRTTDGPHFATTTAWLKRCYCGPWSRASSRCGAAGGRPNAGYQAAILKSAI